MQQPVRRLLRYSWSGQYHQVVPCQQLRASESSSNVLRVCSAWPEKSNATGHNEPFLTSRSSATTLPSQFSSASLLRGLHNSAGHGASELYNGLSTEAALERAAPPRSTGIGPLQVYRGWVAQGTVQQDERQEQIAGVLDQLLAELELHQSRMEAYEAELNQWLATRKELREALIAAEVEEEERKRADEKRRKDNEGFVARWMRRRRGKAEPGAGRAVARVKREKALDQRMRPRPIAPESPRGVYLYGSVGCGKTLLMDLMYNSAAGVVKKRRRMHFHAAMLEVHSRMHSLEQAQAARLAKRRAEAQARKESDDIELTAEYWGDDISDDAADILDTVADEFMGVQPGGCSLALVCFDELQVTDVFTAVVLGGLLERLLTRGAVIVATSNRAPKDLNKDGLQRELFERFVQRLEQHCQPLLVGITKDYRRVIAETTGEGLPSSSADYLWPVTCKNEELLEQQWRQLAQQESIRERIPVLFGRSLEAPCSAGGVARFRFEDLCSRPVGAADYIALCQRFHTVVITDIPVMSMRIRDQARRFITLVDELYNHRCRLICTAAAPPDQLFCGQEEMEGSLIDLESVQFETAVEGVRLRRDVTASGGVTSVVGGRDEKRALEALFSGREESFAFKRAISRLIEMQTPLYKRFSGEQWTNATI